MARIHGVALMEGKTNTRKVLVRKPERNRSLVHIGVDGRILLRWILKKQVVKVEWIHLPQERMKWRALLI
jgi:hypothetical protein